MEAKCYVKSGPGSEMIPQYDDPQAGMISCYQHSANREINATSADLISNRSMLYVLIHALARGAKCFHITIVHRISAGIWDIVQEGLSTDASRHSSLTIRADTSEQHIR